MLLDTRHKHERGVVDILDDSKKKKSTTYAKGTNLTVGAVRCASLILRLCVMHCLFSPVSCNSMSGQLAVADKEGIVHLFSNPSDGVVRAKTNLDQFSGLGEIVGVDVSGDGKWVLWTTRDRILLANVEFRDSKSNQLTSGFSKPMGEAKSDILELRLLPDEMAQLGLKPEQINFVPAKFDNGAFLVKKHACVNV